MTLRILLPPRPEIDAITGTGTKLAAITPGEYVTIAGQKLAPADASGNYSETGLYPTAIFGTSVTFNGITAPILAVRPNGIDTMVPYGVAGQSAAEIVVKRWFVSSTAVSVPVKESAPRIVSITNYEPPDYVPNTQEAPIEKGAVLVVFATGVGTWNPTAPDNGIDLAAVRFTSRPVSLTIGGQPATIYYAGAAPYHLWGMMQIIAYVPRGIDSGTQKIVLGIGENDNAAQESVVHVR